MAKKSRITIDLFQPGHNAYIFLDGARLVRSNLNEDWRGIPYELLHELADKIKAEVPEA